MTLTALLIVVNVVLVIAILMIVLIESAPPDPWDD